MKLITDIPLSANLDYKAYVASSLNDGTRNFVSRNSFDEFNYADCTNTLAGFVKANHETVIQLIDFMIESDNGNTKKITG